MGIDGFDPFIEKPAFGLVLLAVLTFGFQYQHVTGCESDEKVGPILPHHAVIDVEYLEPEVIVLHPRRDRGVAIKGKGLGRLPRAVIDAEIE